MLHPDYRDMLVALCDHRAEFVVVGAYALAAHGLVRSTGDIDLWVRPTEENADRVWSALEQFGAPLFDLRKSDLATPGMVFQIGVAPVRIDILTSIRGVSDFQNAYQRATAVSLGDVEVLILSRDLLLQNKRASGRPKDQGDIAWLQAHVGDES